jgi:hypothetical protein
VQVTQDAFVPFFQSNSVCVLSGQSASSSGAKSLKGLCFHTRAPSHRLRTFRRVATGSRVVQHSGFFLLNSSHSLGRQLLDDKNLQILPVKPERPVPRHIGRYRIAGPLRQTGLEVVAIIPGYK